MPDKMPKESSNTVHGKREAILAAAEVQFSQYGFRRTSMDDIARETGISRASLYTYFDNKEEIFRSLSEGLYRESIEAAAQIMEKKRGREPIEDRTYAGLCAFYARLYGILESTPHGTEIMDASSRLSSDIAQAYATRLEALLAAELRKSADAGEIDLKSRSISAASAAEMIRLSSVGMKQGAANFAGYKKKLSTFLSLFFAGLKKA